MRIKNKKYIIFLGLLLLIFLSGCADTKKSESTKVGNDFVDTSFYLDISAEEARDLIENQSNLIIVDVSDQFKEGHIADAINIPLAELESRISQLDKTKNYLVYSRIPAYSQAAASRLAESGFEQVYRLDDDIAGWIRAGYEIKK